MIKNKLKLKIGKKSGKYEISQDIFVVTIFICDKSLCQCTLNSESTPFSIIEYLTQKINLEQTEFYGFKYQLKCSDPDKRIYRWLEFDKPVKKQLDKYACKPRSIQLSILYSTINPSLICDKMSRSIYFYLTKNDVINGKFLINIEKYLTLAAYSLQVEYGDFDPSFHTIEFLKNVHLLPYNFINNGQVGEEYLLKILNLYERLGGINSSQAAILYLIDVISSPGYGEEYLNCKDEDSTEVSIGYSFNGIIVKKYHTDNIFISWRDIKTITSSKRYLLIKSKHGKVYQYLFEDPTASRYTSILFNWQFKYSTTIGMIQKNIPLEINNIKNDDMIVFVNNPKILSFQGTSYMNTNVNNNSSNNNNINEILQNIMPHKLSNEHSNSKVIDNPITLNKSINSQSSVSITKSTISNFNRNSHDFDILQQQQNFTSNNDRIQKTLVGSSPEINLLTRAHNYQSHDSEGSHLKFIKRSSDRGRRANMMAAGAAKAKQHDINNFYTNYSESFEDNFNGQHYYQKNVNKFRSTPNLASIKQHPKMGISSLKNGYNNNANNYILPPPYIKSSTNVGKKFSNPMTLGHGNGNMNNCNESPKSIIVTSSNCSNNNGVSSYYSLYNEKQVTLCNDNNIDSGRDSISTEQYNHNEKVMTSSIEDDDFSHIEKKSNIEKEVGHDVKCSFDSNVKQNDNIFQRKRPQLRRQDSCDLKSTQGDEDQLSLVISSPDNYLPYTNTTISPATIPDTTTFDDMEGIKCENNLCFGLEDTLRLLLKKLSNSSSLNKEFNDIPKKRITAGTSTSLNVHNLTKNRSNYILPYEDTRVMLTTSKDNPDGYINASHVKIPLGHQLLHYVITQNPLNNTINDFWQMVWEKGIYVIVMIQKIFNSKTVPTYWPGKIGEKLKLSMFSLRLKSTNKYNNIIILKCLKTGKKRTIYHLQYSELDDYNVPTSTESFLAFLDTVNSVQRHVYNTIKDNERILEHTQRLSMNSNKKSSRSRSVSRVNLLDVTNKFRSLSSDNKKNVSTSTGVNDQRSTNSFSLTTDSINSSQRSSQNSYTDSGKGSHNGDDDKFNNNNKKNIYPPILVHCIDGTNESGVFLLTDVILKCLENNIPFEINQILRIMRQQRMSLMQSVGQYRFVHSTISQYLQKSRLI
uniref:protein-tyrosine-phosphatase n=1 Tax=Parastrongyloides trichosuri TaxID=131310 RepID=A0A0N4ZQ00_PARTI